jgi:hypothetical protein
MGGDGGRRTLAKLVVALRVPLSRRAERRQDLPNMAGEQLLKGLKGGKLC